MCVNQRGKQRVSERSADPACTAKQVSSPLHEEGLGFQQGWPSPVVPSRGWRAHDQGTTGASRQQNLTCRVEVRERLPYARYQSGNA